MADKKKDSKKRSEKPKQTMFHWAEFAAEKVIREKGDKKKYTVASGITPSGLVHIGNFREIITVELVKRALEKRGKEVRFIYSWDNFDVFRKVPKGMPKQDMLEKCLRKPIIDIEDPYEKESSYARHNEVRVEEEVKLVGVFPEFIYQAQKYRAGDYAKEIKFALDHTEEIKEILNEFREKPLAKDWLPIGVFSKKFGNDKVKNVKYDGEWSVSYELEDGSTETVDLRKGPDVKLRWRIDWPMRWNFEEVDYEPGGKDHSSPGGSFDTGKRIIEKLWKRDAPTYVMYDNVRIKGQTSKISSSSGGVLTIKDVLEVYEPAILRYLFAGTRPNAVFAISFDADVIKIYEDFDKVERIYYSLEKVKEKEEGKQKVIYELSCVDKPAKSMPFQPSFRHLTMVLQINELDIDKAIGYYEKQLKNESDKERLRTRAQCAVNWLQKYAPEEFKFEVQDSCKIKVDAKGKKILNELAEKLQEKDWTDKELHEEMYVLITNNEYPTGDFFKLAYGILLNKPKGPKLASFILEIGRERVAKLFASV